MTITEEEKARLFAEFEQGKQRELTDRMTALGRVRSAKKAKSSRANAKKALAARMKKQGKRNK